MSGIHLAHNVMLKVLPKRYNVPADHPRIHFGSVVVENDDNAPSAGSRPGTERTQDQRSVRSVMTHYGFVMMLLQAM